MPDSLDRRIEREASLPATGRGRHVLLCQQCALLGQILAAAGRVSQADESLRFRDLADAAEIVLRRHAPRESITHDLLRPALALIEDRL